MATTAELQTERAALVTARDKILAGAQSYQAEGRTLTRADLDTVLRRIKEIDVLLGRAARGGGLGYGVPVP